MLNAAELLADLRRSGIDPKVINGDRLAFPSGVLTDAQRQAIRESKTEIIALLSDVANAKKTNDWRTLAAEYYVHHFSCHQCIAAGQNQTLARCTIGFQLWQTYQMAHAALHEDSHE